MNNSKEGKAMIADQFQQTLLESQERNERPKKWVFGIGVIPILRFSAEMPIQNTAKIPDQCLGLPFEIDWTLPERLVVLLSERGEKRRFTLKSPSQ
jgi:hypothetical protein